jgi:hypothetical protein
LPSEDFFYKGHKLHCVNDFNYLGTVFNYTGNFALNQEQLVGKALNKIRMSSHPLLIHTGSLEIIGYLGMNVIAFIVTCTICFIIICPCYVELLNLITTLDLAFISF